MANIRQICPELRIRARNEANEVESRIPEDIEKIRDWIKKLPHLRARTDDQFLLAFLRGCKHSLEKTKSKIDYYYTIKTLSPEVFLWKQIDDKTMRLNRLGPFLALSKPIEIDGPKVILIRYGHIDINEFSGEDIFRLQLRILDILLFEDDNVSIGGLLYVVDFTSLTVSHVMNFSIALVKKISVFGEKAIPFRIKGIHLINTPSEAMFVINTVRNILPKKIEERLFAHTTWESLYKEIPQIYLPKEYGGENGSLEDAIDYWEKYLLRYKDFFDEDVKYGVNEKLRPGEKVSLESLFGLEGSFRKLEID